MILTKFTNYDVGSGTNKITSISINHLQSLHKKNILERTKSPTTFFYKKIMIIREMFDQPLAFCLPIFFSLSKIITLFSHLLL